MAKYKANAWEKPSTEGADIGLPARLSPVNVAEGALIID